MTDPIKEEDKKELTTIVKRISKKPKNQKVYKDALFLKKFTLALMGQYSKKPHPQIFQKDIDNLTMDISQIGHSKSGLQPTSGASQRMIQSPARIPSPAPLPLPPLKIQHVPEPKLSAIPLPSPSTPVKTCPVPEKKSLAGLEEPPIPSKDELNLPQQESGLGGIEIPKPN